MTGQSNFEIIPGETKVGRWTLLSQPFKKDDTGWDFVKARCTCGATRDIYLKNLAGKRTASCGKCKLNRSIQEFIATAMEAVEDRLRESSEAQAREVASLTANVRNLSITLPRVPTPPPVPPTGRALAPTPGPTAPRPVVIEAGTTDIAALQERVMALLDPARDENPRSIQALLNLSPPPRYNPNPSVEQLQRSFERNNYFITPDQLFAVHQAISQGKPLLCDGPPGTGKTEIARQIALAMGLNPENPLDFHTLYCTPDITKGEALYNWNDSKRLLDIQLVREMASKFPLASVIEVFARVQESAYSERYLDVQSLLRPCVIRHRTVVLGDEIDKTYPEFDSYLLDVVVKNQFEVPGYGPVGRRTFDPLTSPIFIFTTNRERELNRALARRLKPVWFDYLPEKLEAKVILAKCGLDEMTAGRAAQFFTRIRSSDIHLHQPPSTAEVIETCRALNEDGEGITPANLFRYHPHWIKFRRDYDALKDKYYRSGKWVEAI